MSQTMLFQFQKAQKFYDIHVSRNLLGCWQITRCYGRLGTCGRLHHEIVESTSVMRSRVRQLIRYRIDKRHYHRIRKMEPLN